MALPFKQINKIDLQKFHLKSSLQTNFNTGSDEMIKRCQHLQSQLIESEQQVQKLWSEKDEIHYELDEIRNAEIEVRQENVKLRKVNEELNRSLIDIKHNQSLIYDDCDDNFEESLIQGPPTNKETEKQLLQQIAFHESVIKCMNGEHKAQQEEYNAEINALKFKLQQAEEDLEETEKQSSECANTIFQEKQKYELKIEEYNRQLTKVKAENTLKLAEFNEQMDGLSNEIKIREDKLLYWKEVADRKSKELNIMSRKLNSERAERTSANKLYRTQSIKTQRIQAEKQDLERELAASRMKIMEYEKKKTQNKIKKFLKRFKQIF